MQKTKNLTKEKLYNLIVLQGKRCKDVAALFDITPEYLSRLLKKYNIDKKDKHKKKKFGHLEIIEPIGQDIFGHTLWKCKCDCGKEVFRTYSTFSKQGSKSCGCYRLRTNFNHHLFKGYGQISKYYWSQIKKSAESRNLEFNITIEFAWNLFNKQNGICSLSGILLKFATHSKIKDRTASLDRIDNTIGYIENNVRWVHKNFNIMKMGLDDKQFIDLCKIVAEYNNK